MVSYYKFIEGGRVIPEKFAIPLLYELEREREREEKPTSGCELPNLRKWKMWASWRRKSLKWVRN